MNTAVGNGGKWRHIVINDVAFQKTSREHRQYFCLELKVWNATAFQITDLAFRVNFFGATSSRSFTTESLPWSEIRVWKCKSPKGLFPVQTKFSVFNRTVVDLATLLKLLSPLWVFVPPWDQSPSTKPFKPSLSQLVIFFFLSMLWNKVFKIPKVLVIWLKDYLKRCNNLNELVLRQALIQWLRLGRMPTSCIRELRFNTINSTL